MFIYALHINHQNKDQNRNVYTAFLLPLQKKKKKICFNGHFYLCKYFLCCFGLVVEIKLAEVFNKWRVRSVFGFVKAALIVWKCVEVSVEFCRNWICFHSDIMKINQNFKFDMKQKLRESFPPYCVIYTSETASGTRTNVGRGLILSVGNWLDGCGFYWWISCEWQVAPPSSSWEEKRCCKVILIQAYEEHEFKTMMCTNK